MELVRKRVGNRSSWNEGKVGYNTFIITSVLLFLHFNLSIRQKGIDEPGLNVPEFSDRER